MGRDAEQLDRAVYEDLYVLPQRVRGSLYRYGWHAAIESVGDVTDPDTLSRLKRTKITASFLQHLSDDDLLGIRNIGPEALREIRRHFPYNGKRSLPCPHCNGSGFITESCAYAGEVN